MVAISDSVTTIVSRISHNFNKPVDHVQSLECFHLDMTDGGSLVVSYCHLPCPHLVQIYSRDRINPHYVI